jgi:hypothetical protein
MEVMINVLYHSKASATDKVVLLGIANHHGDGGAWPSLETLGRYANVSERQVSRSIKALEALGELSIDHNRGLNVGRNKTNRYWINLTCPPECDGTMNHRIDGVTHPTRRVDISDADGQTDVSGEPVIEPVKEPIRKSSKIDMNFKPSEEMLNWFVDAKIPVDPNQQTQLFIDYYLSNGKTMKDWSAAWRNWMRKAADYQKPVWERSKDIQAVESKIRSETDKEITKKLIEDSRKAAEGATPPPQCEHGKSLVRCIKCSSRLT